VITGAGSSITAAVLETNEELVVARETLKVVSPGE
jgi:acetate kinase